MNEIKTYDISYQRGEITFRGYEKFKNQALEIAEYINSVELSNDNVKDVKKDLADARKVVKEIDKVRVDLKKKLLESYDVFESQINEIKAIIDNADNKLRIEVRELEERERQEKKKEIEELFNKRINMYPEIIYLFDNPFDKFIKPSHLNKSMSMSKVEKAMVRWLEDTHNDIDLIYRLDHSEELLVEYKLTLNITNAIAIVENRYKELERMESKKEVKDVEIAYFKVTGDKDIALTELLLKQNKINFEKK